MGGVQDSAQPRLVLACGCACVLHCVYCVLDCEELRGAQPGYDECACNSVTPNAYCCFRRLQLLSPACLAGSS